MHTNRTLLVTAFIASLLGVLLLAPGGGLAGERVRTAALEPAEDLMFSGYVLSLIHI